MQQKQADEKNVNLCVEFENIEQIQEIGRIESFGE
jgi:hypothetical protein